MKQQEILFDTSQREAFFILMYKEVFPSVAKYVNKHGGSLNDAKDVFQDSLVIYYEKVLTQNLECRNEQAYLMGIARHLWLKKFKLARRPILEDYYSADVPDTTEPQPSTDKLLFYLEITGQKCLNLLKAFYYDRLPVGKIASLFGYTGERSATVQKYKCLEKVRNSVKQKSLQYEDFVE